MRIRVAYALRDEPTRWSRKLLGQMTIDPECVSVDGPQPVRLRLSEIRGLSFRRKLGLFHVVLDAEPKMFFTAVVISLGGMVNVISESLNTSVYTALWQLLGGPGRCARCKYDLRQTIGRCPECGSARIRPVA
jgi:hypothetical protein